MKSISDSNLLRKGACNQMNNANDYILKSLLHNWLNGNVIEDFYLFEAFVYISKVSCNIDDNNLERYSL